MPIYEYQCSDCGHRLEVIQKINDSLLVECPECSEPSLKRLISAVAFRLKGTGWYETDFKHKGRAPAQSGEEKPGATKTEDKQGKADSKDSADKSASKAPKKASAVGSD